MLKSRAFQRVAICVLGALLLLVVGAKRLRAQAVTANISGTVTDSSGAVIAGAQVVVANKATGVATTLTTNDQGRYNAPDLVVGPYEVRASKAGFQTVVQSNINANVGSQLVINLSLPVGEAQQTVTVETSIAQVETQSTAVSTLVSPQQMVDLPLNGRNFEQLLNLAPGVTPTGAGTTTLYGTGPGFSIAGARTEGEQFLLDNTNMSDFWNHQAGSQVLGTSLGIEAIQEFQFLTNTYSSQFGGNGSVMNAASKSGTNDFHGSVYEFLRNSALDSRSYFETASDLKKLPFRRNQFGGSLGGPVKKNKLFFFGNYEGFRQALDQPLSNVGYPEPYVVGDGVTGQLPCSALSGFPPGSPYPGCPPVASGAPGSATNPFEGVPIGSGATGQNAAAASAIDGILGIYNQHAPTPAAGATDQGGYYFTTISATQRSREDYVLGRVDYTLSPSDNIFGRYVFDRGYNLSPLTGIFGAVLPLWP
ncbi:MAG TPA: carboxypeptidase-like regulatory domain-containing protein, partial [Candidatus Acidoferrales bacterium]